MIFKEQAMKELGGFKMGPFELMDFIGNDVNYAVTVSVFKSFYYDPKYKPSLTQKQYKDTKSQVIRLSESVEQIEAATEYIKEYPRAKLFGISNKGNLIFKQGISEVKITKFGDIL